MIRENYYGSGRGWVNSGKCLEVKFSKITGKFEFKNMKKMWVWVGINIEIKRENMKK